MTPHGHEPKELPEPLADWLTVPDAAARFGVPERTLRRAVSRLENDTAGNSVSTRQIPRTTRTGPGLVTGFPFDLLERLAGEIRASGDEGGQSVPPFQSEQETRQELGDDPAQHSVSNSADPAQLGAVEGLEAVMLREALARERDAVTRLEAENGRLWEALKGEQENTRAALDELSRAREQSQILIAAVGSGRLQLPAQDAETMQQAQPAGPGPNEAQETLQDDLQADGGESRQVDQHEKRAPFWAFWRR